MKKLLNYINDKVFVKIVWLHTTTMLTKITAGLLTTKFIALFIGAEGLALIGNLRNFLTSIQSFGTAGLYNAVVKNIGAYKNDLTGLSKVVSTSYYIGFAATLLVSFLCYFNADTINLLLFSERYDYGFVIKILALATPFYALNMFCFSIMNGFAKYKFLMILNIIGQLMGLAVTLYLIYKNHIDGALVAVVIAPSLMFLITLVGILNRRNLMKHIKISAIDYSFLKKFSTSAIMAVITGIALPLILIGIRNYIIEVEGMQYAGYWEAMNRISSYYLLFVNSIMTLYFLPRFSEIDTIKEFRKEIFDFYKTIMPYFALGLVVLYLLRSYIISLLLTEDFKPVADLFFWQMLGDFVKVMSMVIAYQFIAKRMFVHFVITQLFLIMMTYFSSIYLVDAFGVEGANIGHFVSYLLYYIMVLLIFGSSLFGVLSEDDHRLSD